MSDQSYASSIDSILKRVCTSHKKKTVSSGTNLTTGILKVRWVTQCFLFECSSYQMDPLAMWMRTWDVIKPSIGTSKAIGRWRCPELSGRLAVEGHCSYCNTADRLWRQLNSGSRMHKGSNPKNKQEFEYRAASKMSLLLVAVYDRVNSTVELAVKFETIWAGSW